MSFIRVDEVQEIIPMSRATLYRWADEGKFPKRIIISDRISGWNREDVLNWMRKRKGPDPPIKYHDKMRQWEEGTWPVYHTWKTNDDGSFKKALYWQQVDDGTDDNEVVNMQHRADMH